MGVDHDAKYFLNVFPGRKAQITDCQVRKQITLTFTCKHTFMHSLYKCLLIMYHAPGAGNSAVREIGMDPRLPAFTFTLTCAREVLGVSLRSSHLPSQCLHSLSLLHVSAHPSFSSFTSMLTHVQGVLGVSVPTLSTPAQTCPRVHY